MRYRLWSVVGVAGCLVTVAACGSSAKSTGASSPGSSASSPGSSASSLGSSQYPPIPAGPITFAVETPVSGANAAYGIPTKDAFEKVTISQFDSLYPNGIDGHPVRLKVYDDGSDVTKAVATAHQIVADRVTAAVTVSTAPTTTAQETAVLNAEKIPVIAYPGANTYADTARWPYVFNDSATNLQEGAAAAAWIGKHPEIKSIAVLTDGLAPDLELLNDITTPLAKDAPNAHIVKQVSMSPGAVEVSVQISQLKAVNPDLLLVDVGYGYGPIWQAIQTESWSPKVMVSAGAWYDGFDAMTSLRNNAVSPYLNCVQPGAPPTTFSTQMQNLMAAYVSVFGKSSVNYLTFVQSDLVPMILAAKAIQYHHSTSPAAIKNALESMGTIQVLNTFEYHFTPTDHFGVTGSYGDAVCKSWPLAFGPDRIPTIAP